MTNEQHQELYEKLLKDSATAIKEAIKFRNPEDELYILTIMVELGNFRRAESELRNEYLKTNL